MNVTNDSRTIWDLLASNVPGRAERPALTAGATTVPYAELVQRAEACAAWLADRGVRPGDRVGIHLPKSVEEAVATFAAARLGAVFVNIHAQSTPRQLAHIVADCGIRLLITDRRHARALLEAELLDGLDHVLVAGDAPVHPKMTAWETLSAEATPPTVQPAEGDLAALLYTSGSTGRPKGVMLSHRNLVLGARSVASYLGNAEHDRVLGLLPLSFDYGLNQLTTMCLVGGAVVLQPVAFPAEIARTVRERRVTGLAAVPTVWVQLVRHLQEAGERLDGLRYVTNSGGAIPGAILDAMPEVLPGADIVLMYGLTEAFRSTWLSPGQFAAKRGAIGYAIPNAEVFVVDPERGLCGPDEPGELIHRGPLICHGYWGDPDATAAKIKPCPALRDRIGDEPVIYSGDLVRRDADGCLWFIGRADSLIKSSGFRISPTEVEEVVFESGLVTGVVAFGVPDEALGQAVHVAASPAGPNPIDADALARHCAREMPAHMVPRRIHAWPGSMPRTTSGKIDRPAVIRACTEPS